LLFKLFIGDYNIAIPFYPPMQRKTSAQLAVVTECCVSLFSALSVNWLVMSLPDLTCINDKMAHRFYSSIAYRSARASACVEK
jgi:hypothetical protein